MENEELEKSFQDIVKRIWRGKEVTGEKLRYAVAAICVPLMYGSSSRPGAIVNVTQTEFEEGRW